MIKDVPDLRFILWRYLYHMPIAFRGVALIHIYLTLIPKGCSAGKLDFERTSLIEPFQNLL